MSSQRVEDLGRGAAGRQRADGEELARPERAVGIGLRVVRAAADQSALDDVERRDGTGLRREDRGVPGKRGLGQVRHEPAHDLVAHAGERRVAAQELDRGVHGRKSRRRGRGSRGHVQGKPDRHQVARFRPRKQKPLHVRQGSLRCGCGRINAPRLSSRAGRCSGGRTARPTCPRNACRGRAANPGSPRGSPAESRRVPGCAARTAASRAP